MKYLKFIFTASSLHLNLKTGQWNVIDIFWRYSSTWHTSQKTFLHLNESQMIKCVIACEICISVIVILLWNIVSYFPLLVNNSGENYLVWFSLQHHSHFYSYRISRWSTASFLIVAYIIHIYICRFVTSGYAKEFKIFELKWN